MLSKVSRNVRQHPTANSHQQYTDLYLSINPSGGRHSIRGGISDSLLRLVRDRLAIIINTQVNPPNVKWSGAAAQRAAVRSWPVRVRNEGPPPLLRRVPTVTVTSTLHACLRSIIRGKQMTTEYCSDDTSTCDHLMNLSIWTSSAWRSSRRSHQCVHEGVTGPVADQNTHTQTLTA